MNQGKIHFARSENTPEVRLHNKYTGIYTGAGW